jgi:hypothetical protein
MKTKIFAIATLTCLLSSQVHGQNKDKAVFKEVKPGYYQNIILKEDQEMKEKNKPAPGKNFTVDLSGISLPNRTDLFKNQQWHKCSP